MIVHPYDAGPWGRGVLRAVDGAVIDHEEPRVGSVARARGDDDGTLAALAERLRRALQGEPDDFLDVDCAPAIRFAGLTPFEAAVIDVVRRIPRGATASYGEVAILAGRPGAARAAGTACGRGVLPLIVPYHRVIRSDGGIGEYGDGPWGRERKRRLLALEGARAH